jgi:tRNA modification GTPase
VVCRRNDDHVEVHCHGGDAAVRAIVESLVALGCEELDWRAWTRQTIEDPIVAEARIALADAPTDRTAAILWDQHNGALRRGLDAIVAAIDGGDFRVASDQVAAILAQAPVGRHLIEPWRVVLTGRPNVGKSSLINALVGYPRAIVHSTPGTTRDAVTTQTAIDGWPVELSDTAGLRESSDPIEAAGIRMAEQRLAGADLVVLVLDASIARTSDDDKLLAAWPTALVVYNKIDLVERARLGERGDGIATNAVGGQGIADLAAAVGRRLVPSPPAPGQAVAFCDNHFRALREVEQALGRGQSAAARQMLALVGRDSS